MRVGDIESAPERMCLKLRQATSGKDRDAPPSPRLLPKQPLGDPAQVLEYLGRYTHRVAISNERIVAVDDKEVRIRVRTSA